MKSSFLFRYTTNLGQEKGDNTVTMRREQKQSEFKSDPYPIIPTAAKKGIGEDTGRVVGNPRSPFSSLRFGGKRKEAGGGDTMEGNAEGSIILLYSRVEENELIRIRNPPNGTRKVLF